jgi:BRCT domain type II-containing protein
MDDAQPKKPPSVFENFVSIIAKVPKAEADAVEAEEDRRRAEQREQKPKPTGESR